MDSSAHTLSAIIDKHRRDIEERWLERVLSGIAPADGPEAAPSFTALRDGIADYLDNLVDLLRDGADVPADRRMAWADVAREHGVTRVALGFDISQLIREFIALRHVILDVAHAEGVAVDGPEALLSDIFEAAIAEAVSAYVDARDYEARQKQAENIGFMIHELRSPLSAAALTAQRLRRSVPPELLPLCDRLDRNHHRVGALIDNLLLSHKLASGKMEVTLAEVRLGDVLESATATGRAVAEEKGIEFHLSYDPGIALRVDRALTESALVNVVDNAAKFTDVGHIDVSVDDVGDEIVVHVRDSCDGLSAAELRTIFEPFRRGSSRKPGTGLGLAIAKRAVEAQGGSIHAESDGVAGCHFWITLPKHLPRHEEATPPP